MKKLIFILASISVLAIACSKEVSSPDAAPEGLSSGSILTLKAIVPPTKVNVAPGTGDATWKEGDAIAVYNTDGTKFKLTLSEGAGTYEGTFSGDFTGTPDEGSPAIYPYDFAADTPWDVVLPEYIPWEDNVRAVMVAEIDGSGATPDPIHFTHVMSVLEITLQDVPAYARGLQLTSEALAQLSGTFTINETNDGVEASGATTGKQVIHFPYKTGYGADATVKICAVLPAGEYPDLTVCVIDGDEDAIEGTTKAVPASASNLAAGDYVSMKTPLNVRSLVGTARDKFVKVEGVKWAKGNLRYWGAAGNTEGWQDGWNVYDAQWKSQWSLLHLANDETTYPQSKSFNLNDADFIVDDEPDHWDYFTWGKLGANSRISLPEVSAYSPNWVLCGKVLHQTAASSETADRQFTDRMTRVTTSDRYNNPPVMTVDDAETALYGDIAYWASKGQYQMPSAEQLKLLVDNANIQFSIYITVPGKNKKIYGLLFTPAASWEERTTHLWETSHAASGIEITEADLEAGVFLPCVGLGYVNGSSDWDNVKIQQWNSWGAYFSGTYTKSGYPYDAATLRWANSATYAMPVVTEHSATMSVTIGRSKWGHPIRPVYIGN